MRDRIAAGEMDRRIRVDRSTPVTNDFNEDELSWATLDEVWAKVEPVSDAEKVRAGETLATKTSRFVVRYQRRLAELDVRDRIVFENRTYEVLGVKEIGRRAGLEITAAARGENLDAT